MEATALCFRLLMLEFLLEMHIQSGYTRRTGAALLRVDPNRLQHFEYKSLSFHCDGFDGSIKLRGTRNTEEFPPVCEVIKTSCTISKTYPTDMGEYWCESEAGKRSNSVNITITAGPVILDSPALPLLEGDVTLSCMSRKTSTKQAADFYKDGVLVRGSPSEQVTVHNVSKSDEGLYKCSITGVGTSPESFLAVGANTVSTTSPPAYDEPEYPRDLVVMLVPLMVLLLLLLVALIYIRRRIASSKTPTAASNSGEAASAASGGEAEDDVNSLTYAVVTKKRPDKGADESSVQPLYSTVMETRCPAESGSSGSTLALNPRAAKESSLPEPEIVYSVIQM
ncbi:low affinity immunoglobulin gamma Fc region receptor II-like [Stegastes partitus]|uniref:low affinity immunoglobulin gamma Fc region receptor II-like n=1 Tax=Stegastes partitus TaxID=144197 RepID=UPI00049700E4|nr:PREDICTED: low affinity immunoglobulin gamma Fc region receptor II-like [Stegastes partitus]